MMSYSPLQCGLEEELSMALVELHQVLYKQRPSLLKHHQMISVEPISGGLSSWHFIVNVVEWFIPACTVAVDLLLLAVQHR